jgi:hypothetical protein
MQALGPGAPLFRKQAKLPMQEDAAMGFRLNLQAAVSRQEF